MNSKNIVVGVVALALGLVIGYCCFTQMHTSQPATGSCVMMDAKANQEKMMGHSMGSMEHQMMTMTDRMKGKTGDELDKIFLEDMIVHHQGAVDMAQILVKETKRPELQKMGADIIRVQTAEIAQMRAWLTEWSK